MATNAAAVDATNGLLNGDTPAEEDISALYDTASFSTLFSKSIFICCRSGNNLGMRLLLPLSYKRSVIIPWSMLPPRRWSSLPRKATIKPTNMVSLLMAVADQHKEDGWKNKEATCTL
jgi:hypothetical protein